jgi:hypothetical protein
MNKKDRIAVVASIVYLFLVCLISLGNKDIGVLIFLLFLLGYWGYRFIKNDISFLKVKDE